MIQFKCYVKGNYLGTIIVRDRGILLENADARFETFVKYVVQKGFYFKKLGKTISSIDKEFIFILEKFLQRCGARIIRQNPELLEKLKNEMKKADSSIPSSLVNEACSDLTIYETSLLLEALHGGK